MAFDALDVTIELIRTLRPALVQIRSKDRSLHDQVRRAATSIALNLAEGRARSGADRRHFFRIAAGSAGEVQAALDVAEAFGDLDRASLAVPLALLRRVRSMLWRLCE